MCREQEALGHLKAALVADRMVLTDGTPQVLGLTAEDRRAWEPTGGAATTVAKDLGVDTVVMRAHTRKWTRRWKHIGADRAPYQGRGRTGATVHVGSALFGRCSYEAECQIWPDFGRSCPDSTKFGLDSATCGPGSANIGPDPARSDPHLSTVGPG